MEQTVFEALGITQEAWKMLNEQCDMIAEDLSKTELRSDGIKYLLNAMETIQGRYCIALMLNDLLMIKLTILSVAREGASEN